MLPGFRFIIMTMVLGTSVLIFGLGAAALLRATHEEFASLPSLRTTEKQPPVTFAERFDAAVPPTLALLRVEPKTASPLVTNAETASVNAHPETPQLSAKPARKTVVKRKGRKRMAHVKRARIRAAAARTRPVRRTTRLVQRTMPAEPFSFLFLN